MNSRVTIKDFKEGDIAYCLKENKGRNKGPTITEVSVSSVGRIYVTTEKNPFSRKYRNHDKEYLIEQASFGEHSLLFRTKEEAENYLEKFACKLAVWLGCLSVMDAEKYSYEQLKKVKEILEG